MVYDIVDVPANAPVTTPVEPTTVALPLLLVQVPPAGPLLSVVLCPTHTLVLPVIAKGNAFTVTTVVTRQPVDNV